MRFRDRVVIVDLVVSAVVACLLWHPVGRWAALAVVLAGLLVAAAVYRLRAPAFGLNEEIRVPGVRLHDDGRRPDAEPSDVAGTGSPAFASTRRPSSAPRAPSSPGSRSRS